MREVHIPVLLHEVIDGLILHEGDVVCDATLGGGGYAEAICQKIGKSGVLIGLDQDHDAVERVAKRLSLKDYECTKHLVEANFRDIASVVRDLDYISLNAVAFDLGLSSYQLEESGRGFSFDRDEPLEMTFVKDVQKADFTAADIVNKWDEKTLADVFYGYGEERYAKRIARMIAERREKEAFERTGDLVDVVEQAIPKRGSRRHPATRVFQALRIVVNDEVKALEEGLQGAYESLASGGRIAVVSFHSIEDRIVKNFFRDLEKEEKGIRITKKPITPTEEEIQNNPRSRSAKLRIFQKA